MNKFLIVFSALLAVCSVCNAYGPSPTYGLGPAPGAYGARQAINGIAYQVQPALSLNYNTPSVYGTQSGIAIQGLSASAPVYGLGGLLNTGYASDSALGLNALGIRSPAAIVDLNRVLLRRDQLPPASPLLLPAPIGSGYNIVPASGQSASAIANAGAAGQKAYIPRVAASPVLSPGIVVAGGSKSYAPAPAPVYAPGPAGSAYGSTYGSGSGPSY